MKWRIVRDNLLLPALARAGLVLAGALLEALTGLAGSAAAQAAVLVG